MKSVATIQHEIEALRAHAVSQPDADPRDVAGWRKEIAAWEWVIDGHYDRTIVAGRLATMLDDDPDTELALVWVLSEED